HEKIEHIALDVYHLARERIVQIETRETQALLGGFERGDLRADLAGIVVHVARVDAQRAAMGRYFIDIEERQPMPREHLLDGMKRKIRKVLVINRVELALLDQAREMRKLHGDDAMRFQHQLHSRDEVI